jgi:hypothetical protein
MDNTFWQGIAEADYALPQGYTIEALIPELLEMLASPDPIQRDKYAYLILAHWLVKGMVSPDTMREMVKQLKPNLKQGIGERGTDSVFRRSFSALMLATLVNQHHITIYLNDVEMRSLLTVALDYLLQEKDLRAYDPQKGWIHATAHTADLLLVLARSRYLDANNLAYLVYAIADKVKRQTGYVFVHEEDERLARAAVIALLREEVSEKVIDAWFTRLVAITQLTHPPAQLDTPLHSAHVNTKNLLRSLYFQIALAQSEGEELPPRADQLKAKALEALKAFPH